MKEQEIPRESWPGFLEGFSREHRGWLATVGVIDTERLRRARQAARALVRDAVFHELRLEGQAEDSLVVETDREGHLATHCADHPTRVYFEEAEGGEHKGVRIDGADGRTLLVEFRTPARPEALDGLADTEW